MVFILDFENKKVARVVFA